MPPIILTVLQGLFLLLLYVFVARAVTAVVRDVAPPKTPRARPAPAKSSRATGRPGKATRTSPAQASADPPRVAPREIVVHRSGGAPRVVQLSTEDITFGRSGDSTVTISDPYTSDRHARIHYDGKRWLIDDLGSTNGTFLNQVKVTQSTPIAAGDQLGIGRTMVEVRK